MLPLGYQRCSIVQISAIQGSVILSELIQGFSAMQVNLLAIILDFSAIQRFQD